MLTFKGFVKYIDNYYPNEFNNDSFMTYMGFEWFKRKMLLTNRRSKRNIKSLYKKLDHKKVDGELADKIYQNYQIYILSSLMMSHLDKQMSWAKANKDYLYDDGNYIDWFEGDWDLLKEVDKMVALAETLKWGINDIIDLR